MSGAAECGGHQDRGRRHEKKQEACVDPTATRDRRDDAHHAACESRVGRESESRPSPRLGQSDEQQPDAWKRGPPRPRTAELPDRVQPFDAEDARFVTVEGDELGPLHQDAGQQRGEHEERRHPAQRKGGRPAERGTTHLGASRRLHRGEHRVTQRHAREHQMRPAPGGDRHRVPADGAASSVRHPKPLRRGQRREQHHERVTAGFARLEDRDRHARHDRVGEQTGQTKKRSKLAPSRASESI